MANGFDRIERFFSSKRKGSAASNDSSTAPSTAPSSPVEQSTEQQFPSPSFIRPKTSRMAAREEVRQRYPSSRSPSTPDATSSRKTSSQTNSSDLTAASRRLKFSHSRSSSLDSEEYPPLFTGFNFPKPPPRRRGDLSPPFIGYNLKPLPQVPREQISRPSSPLTRFNTPPYSDPEDSPFSSRRPRANKLQIVPYKAPPTPEASPELGPLSDWQLHDDKTVEILDEDLCLDIQRQLEEPVIKPVFAWLNEPTFFPSLNLPSPRLSLSGSSLQEPDVNDFFNLSDDNVAEMELEGCSTSLILPSLVQTPVNITPSVSSMPLLDGPLLTLEPPSANRPAQLAAFEAARIAGRYNFDMLYVVNLWPETTATQYSGSPTPSEEITGRLLTAYGLHNGPSPFQISSETHVKILRSSQWLEYRDDLAKSDDFGRAYACTFYPGQYEEKRGSETTSSSQKLTPSAIDRGLVFAAYRKPSPNGSVQQSGTAELAHLRRDVEAMVEMLIDIHVTSQMRHPAVQTQFPNETGPIPSQEADLS